MNFSKRSATLTRLTALSSALIFFFAGCGISLIGSVGSGALGVPSALSYRCSTQLFLESGANAADTPTVSESGVTYSISPALPSGLSLDPSTGIISGTPTVASSQTAYTVTASNSDGSTTATVNIATANGWMVNDLTHDEGNVGGSGNCSSTTYGTCTLRAAIEEIDTGSSTRTAILLPAGSTTLSLGQLNLTQAIGVYGDCAQGTTIDGNAMTSSMLLLSAGPTVLSNLTLQNTSSATQGGCLQTSGGNYTTTIQNSTFQNCSYTGGAQAGGALYVGNTGTITIEYSIFMNNLAPDSDGGAIATAGGTTNVSHCLFSGNSALGSGGALVTVSPSTVNVFQSLFVENSATSVCGNVAYVGESGGSSVTFTNTTITNNSGAATGVLALGNGSSIFLVNDTISDNNAVGGTGGLSVCNGGTLQLVNTVVSGNTNSGSSEDNCDFSPTSNGYNLSDTTDCGLSAVGDLQNTNPLLETLQSNGGFTQTMALQTGSPAIGAANPAACPSTDQRGYPRLLNGKCDMGAYEHQIAP